MQKTIDVADNLLPLLEKKAQSLGISVAAVLRYAVRRFAVVEFPIEDELAVCSACRQGQHCEGKTVYLADDLENKKRGVGRERRVRWVCVCDHCRKNLGVPLPGPAAVDQYGKLLDETGVTFG